MKHCVDNFELLADVLFKTPLEKDEFYFLQILVRGKDGNDVSGNNKNRLVKYYIVTSKDELLSLQHEVKGICEAVNARAYIHPTRRNLKNVANIAIELSTHTYVSQNWIGLRGAYSTAAGKSFVKRDKKYVVDIDDATENSPIVEDIKNKIFELYGKGGQNSDKIFAVVPTKSGVHLITHPFDTDTFKELYPSIDVHKNNPTLLYYAWDDENS